MEHSILPFVVHEIVVVLVFGNGLLKKHIQSSWIYVRFLFGLQLVVDANYALLTVYYVTYSIYIFLNAVLNFYIFSISNRVTFLSNFHGHYGEETIRSESSVL